ncbi:hypothetical protein ACSTEP_21935 [Vibrio vulnificus]|uniref:hypothetical protein n=1 Tax=Vibrio vulnificus TaxID=672 RepID=UPI003ED863ED
MNLLNAPKQSILDLFNLHIKNHPDYVEGMFFEDITLLPNNTFKLKGNFNYGGKTIEQNYVTGNKVYSDVFQDFIR